MKIKLRAQKKIQPKFCRKLFKFSEKCNRWTCQDQNASWFWHTMKRWLQQQIRVGESLRNMGKLAKDMWESLEKLFHVACLRQHRRTDFLHELEVQKLHKVEFFKSGPYENESSDRELINFCSKSMFNQTVKEKLQKTNFSSILCDDTLDYTVVKEEYICVLFGDPETFHMTISFFSLRDLPSQDVVGIFSPIKKAFADEEIEQLLKNIVFLTSDGTRSFAHHVELVLKWALKGS